LKVEWDITVAEDDERQIAFRCLAGDAGAVRELVERFQQDVFGLCLKMLRHRQDAEDTAQEALVRVVRHLARWDASRPLRPWVLAIAANRCRTLRERKRRIPSPTDVVESLMTPEKGVASHGLSEELDAALGTLREEYRLCFTLHHLHEMGLAEISEILGCPKGTVKTWLFRARKGLAEYLKGRGFADEWEQRASPEGVEATGRER
jgi:RNA polymerase sigma-70 factor (ECF subfamily)